MKNIIKLNSFLKGVFARIILNTKTQDLHYYRILFGIIVFINLQNINFISEVPNSLFRPNVFNAINLLNTWPSYLFLQSLHVLMVLTSLTIILGIKTRISLITFGILTLIKSSILFGFGKIDHNIIIVVTTILLAFTNSGRKLALVSDRKIKNPNLSIAILALFIVFAFFTAGLAKAKNWIDFDMSTSGFLSWFFRGFYTLGRNELLAPLVLELPFWLMEIMDYLAVIFEITGFLFLIHSRKAWYYYIFIACLFHLFNTLFLNISFKPHILIFGIWFFTPFLKRYKILFLIVPVVFYFKDLTFGLIGWLLISIVGLVLAISTKGFKQEMSVN